MDKVVNLVTLASAHTRTTVLQLSLKLLDVGAPTYESQPLQMHSQPVGNTKHLSSVVNLQYTALLSKNTLMSSSPWDIKNKIIDL